jgi:HEAT repeat protein
MKKLLKSSVITRSTQRMGLAKANRTILAAVILLLAAVGVVPALVSRAQKLDGLTTVKGVSSQGSSTGTVVSIAADGSLKSAQTWQDNEGYHVVLPNTVPAEALKLGRGVRLRKVGDSLELVLQTKPGTRVSVEGGPNQLNFLIDGKLETASPADSDRKVATAPVRDNQSFEQSQSPSGEYVTPRETYRSDSPTEGARPAGIGVSTGPKLTGSGPPLISPNEIIPQQQTPVAAPAASEIKIEDEDDGLMASVFSGTSVLIVISLGLVGLLVSRKLRSRQVVVQSDSTQIEKASPLDDDFANAVSRQGTRAAKPEKSTSLVKTNESLPANGTSRQSVAKMPVAGPTSLFGAYRIDQEVGKLLLGQPHRIDVLASRASDDRRAIEASLIKGVNSPNLEERSQIRAREALEEYGFVARQCAALLLAPDAFERTSAARTLGEIRSPSALPFLLEGLYDSESIVRNQAVVSIGELKLPSAIGALLDIARMHPDVPSALLSRTLSACSVEGLDFFDAVTPDSHQLGSGLGNIIEEITHLEPISSVENLPESSDDPQLAQALSLAVSSDVQMRAEALKILVQFRVQAAVDAIGKLARNDSEPNLRSLAISSLGTINHESVFPAVLIGMADESREVRASAARSLNRLSFDRADAYVRVLETGDDETVRDVAKACIQAGIVSQNLDRLVSSDHRQAYETFTVICLLTRANLNQPVLDAILGHPNIDVSLKIIHLLASTGHPAIYDQLRELAVKDGMREEVKTSVLEAMYKLEQSKPCEEEATESTVQDVEIESELPGAPLLEASSDPLIATFPGPEIQPQLEELDF